MMHKPLDYSNTESILAPIHKGMEVRDLVGEKVGEVQDLYFGTSGDEMAAHGAGAATAERPQMRERGFVEDLAQALFGDTEIPEELRDRLLNHGYIEVDGEGLFAADRYVLPEQISRIDNDRVYLRVARRDLIHS